MGSLHHDVKRLKTSGLGVVAMSTHNMTVRGALPSEPKAIRIKDLIKRGSGTLLVLGARFIMPFLWMLSSSLKPGYEVFSYPIDWIPKTSGGKTT